MWQHDRWPVSSEALQTRQMGGVGNVPIGSDYAAESVAKHSRAKVGIARSAFIQPDIQVAGPIVDVRS